VTPAERAVIGQLERLADEMVAFTQALVRIPTINPPGDSYTACAGLVADRLSSLGYVVETLAPYGLAEHTAGRPRVNVVGTLGTGSPVLHFNGHYDVVPPGAGWTVDPFGGELRDELIFGRGTCDQKGGIAASIYAVEAVRRAVGGLAGTVEQSATPDEESGGFAGVAWLCETGRLRRDRQDFVVITEPLDPDRVCIGHRGVYWFELTTLGRVGHGSMPGLAVNAAEQMTRVVNAFETELKPILAQRLSTAPVQPAAARYPSLNLNSIHAGQALDGWQTPAVPDRCTAVFDRRFIHEEAFEDVRAEIVGLLDRQGVVYELKDVMRVDPLLGNSEGKLAGATAGVIRDVLGSEPATIVSPGTYDQKYVVRRAGIDECIAYGPGRLVLAHQANEHLAVSDLVAGAKVLAILTLRLVGAQKG
jgi:succinyl-diaminopimelate desuccinylase